MIDFYEKVDFDQKVWVFEDGAIEQQRLGTVCRDHGDPDSKYWADGCVLYKYRPNRQMPRSVVATFETETEAEHAYWLLLLHHVSTGDTAPDIIWEFADAVEAIKQQIEWAENEVRDRVRYSEGNVEWANSNGHGEKVAYWTAQLEQLENTGGIQA